MTFVFKGTLISGSAVCLLHATTFSQPVVSEERGKCRLPVKFLLRSLCLVIVPSVLVVSDFFFDLWDLQLAMIVRSGFRVMQHRDYSMRQIESDRLKL